MAIQDPKMEATYIHNYNYSLEEFKKQKDSGFSSPVRFGAYHYGSHYSNTGIVAHYLVRLSPYTNVALEYQGIVKISDKHVLFKADQLNFRQQL